MQPVQQAIAWLKGKPPSWVAADFGCGDAQLAASVPHKVHSLDLVASVPGVIACNVADTPLGKAHGASAHFAELACNKCSVFNLLFKLARAGSVLPAHRGCACCLGEACPPLFRGFLQGVVQALVVQALVSASSKTSLRSVCSRRLWLAACCLGEA